MMKNTCRKCQTEIPIKHNWNIVTNYSGCGVNLKWMVCRDCIIEFFPIDMNEVRFCETLIMYKRKHKYSSWNIWPIKQMKYFVEILKEQKIPLYNYPQPVCYHVNKKTKYQIRKKKKTLTNYQLLRYIENKKIEITLHELLEIIKHRKQHHIKK